jgi:hypothetical protein
MPRYERLLRLVLAVAIIGGPLGYVVGALLIPAVHASGLATIEANAAADSLTNGTHVSAFVVASFLLPIGAAGLAFLAFPAAPWLATVGGLLGVVGWVPFASLTALDDLAIIMAHRSDQALSADTLDAFTNDAVMTTYLLVYVICHLLAYVLLGIALLRARVIPRWAGWAMIASSPLTVAAFAFHDGRRQAVGAAALTLLLLGSLPAAFAIGRGTPAVPGPGWQLRTGVRPPAPQVRAADRGRTTSSGRSRRRR